ncbi:MAG: SPFH domain-containing protein [Clostridia bacterium]|nr:SPFH domain-containing protein [Clostridia bacterium]
MSIFNRNKKVQTINFNNVAGNYADTNNALFFRVREAIDDKDAVVEVPFTHTAIILMGSSYKYVTGDTKIFEDKKALEKWQRGMTVDVIYIIKDTAVEVTWGTPNPITFRDPVSGHIVNLGAHGKFEVVVSNPEEFFRRIVGNNQKFDIDDFSRRAAATIVDEFNAVFQHIVEELGISYDKYDANRKLLGQRMGEALSPVFEKKYGLRVDTFTISGMTIDAAAKAATEEVMDPRKIREEEERREEKRKREEEDARREAERLDDKRFERDLRMRDLDRREREAFYSSTARAESKPHCPHCGAENAPAATFCSACGKRVSTAPVTCTQCGAVNPSSAAFCSGCGKKLS